MCARSCTVHDRFVNGPIVYLRDFNLFFLILHLFFCDMNHSFLPTHAPDAYVEFIQIIQTVYIEVNCLEVNRARTYIYLSIQLFKCLVRVDLQKKGASTWDKLLHQALVAVTHVRHCDDATRQSGDGWEGVKDL